MAKIKSPNLGGKRPNAGRPSKAEEAGLAALIDSAVSLEDWREIFATAARHAKRGNIHAMKFLASYRFGNPAQSVDVTSGNEPLQVLIKYAASNDNDTAPTPSAEEN